tara:strand:- start:2300 stop:3448 length:1149 start_codon:yes stop_codon:yes gene_type:complete
MKIIEQAMAKLILDQPFFATILLSMERVEDGSIPTMATNGEKLYYNPDFAKSLHPAELVGVLAHEAMHPACLHHLRKGERDHFKFNVACDYAINPLLKEAGITLPGDALISSSYEGLHAEAIYSKLPETITASPEDGDGDGGDTKIHPGMWGEVIEAKNPDGTRMTDADIREAEGRWKVKVRQAATAAKKAGKLPSGMERFVEELMEPKLNWRTILSRFVGDLARTDYSFRFPNTRYSHTGFTLPSLKSETIGKVIFGMDTSGSMGGSEMRDVLGEVCGALREYEKDGADPEVTVLWCDTEVHEQTLSDSSEFRPKGGGGTDFAPVFEHIKEKGYDPKAVVYMTDGYCHSFGDDPGCPVLWALTNKCDSFSPPFGETMIINQ